MQHGWSSPPHARHAFSLQIVPVAEQLPAPLMATLGQQASSRSPQFIPVHMPLWQLLSGPAQPSRFSAVGAQQG
jgi:hypothetical protein